MTIPMYLEYYVELQIDSQIISVTFEGVEGLTNKQIEREAVRKLKKLVEYSSLAHVYTEEISDEV